MAPPMVILPEEMLGPRFAKWVLFCSMGLDGGGVEFGHGSGAGEEWESGRFRKGRGIGMGCDLHWDVVFRVGPGAWLREC